MATHRIDLVNINNKLNEYIQPNNCLEVYYLGIVFEFIFYELKLEDLMDFDPNEHIIIFYNFILDKRNNYCMEQKKNCIFQIKTFFSRYTRNLILFECVRAHNMSLFFCNFFQILF